jgi:hypothetical protein
MPLGGHRYQATSSACPLLLDSPALMYMTWLLPSSLSSPSPKVGVELYHTPTFRVGKKDERAENA